MKEFNNLKVIQTTFLATLMSLGMGFLPSIINQDIANAGQKVDKNSPWYYDNLNLIDRASNGPFNTKDDCDKDRILRIIRDRTSRLSACYQK